MQKSVDERKTETHKTVETIRQKDPRIETIQIRGNKEALSRSE